ncbi:MAG: Bpu10I family restriction endonuclease [Pseudomonadota bacterium]|nr:Bpu10I family restriction endonuclease [Pseudomonadota bacterium]
MADIKYATPHGDKLKALVSNNKLPEEELGRVSEQINIYDTWVNDMNSLESEGEELLGDLVKLLNSYKKSVEFDLIYCAETDFLYRQKGQLKLDNTILEEFLPRLFDSRLVPGFLRLTGLNCGPKSSFAGLSFDSPFVELSKGGTYIKKKDQDFSVTRKHKIEITRSDNEEDRFSEEVEVSYFATEIKTNLDKTMFQEASATAGELKKATSGSKYILLCEWLDMTPINTKLTAIDEVIVLRKSKRLASNIRSNFSTASGRESNKSLFEKYLNDHPLSLDGFQRLVWHLNECFPSEEHDADDIVLGRGYF